MFGWGHWGELCRCPGASWVGGSRGRGGGARCAVDGLGAAPAPSSRAPAPGPAAWRAPHIGPSRRRNGSARPFRSAPSGHTYRRRCGATGAYRGHIKVLKNGSVVGTNDLRGPQPLPTRRHTASLASQFTSQKRSQHRGEGTRWRAAGRRRPATTTGDGPPLSSSQAPRGPAQNW